MCELRHVAIVGDWYVGLGVERASGAGVLVWRGVTGESWQAYRHAERSVVSFGGWSDGTWLHFNTCKRVRPFAHASEFEWLGLAALRLGDLALVETPPLRVDGEKTDGSIRYVVRSEAPDRCVCVFVRSETTDSRPPPFTHRVMRGYLARVTVSSGEVVLLGKLGFNTWPSRPFIGVVEVPGVD
ncbi:MAG: hypothetical protein AAF654_12325 [Myxococcota bacterium]